MKSKPDLPPGVYEDDTTTTASPVTAAAPLSKAAKKNLKRKEKKKQKALASDISDMSDTMLGLNVSHDKTDQSQGGMQSDGKDTSHAEPTKAELNKKLKNLKKKLRQIEDLQARIDSGELENPDHDQLGKIERKEQILAEIEDIELELVD